MSEYDSEPVPGLPAVLPGDEHILWQGVPDWKRLTGSALHVRLTAAYFAVLAGWAAMTGDVGSAIVLALLGVVVIGLFAAFAWGVQRTTIYTLTNKRLVLRVGVALNTCINLPLGEIESANLKMIGGGHGNIVLSLKGLPRIGYFMLWPHARSLRMMRPQPMLRAIPDAQGVARTLFNATQKVQAIAPLDTRSSRQPDRPLVGATA
jgi:hypothetical protein